MKTKNILIISSIIITSIFTIYYLDKSTKKKVRFNENKNKIHYYRKFD